VIGKLLADVAVLWNKALGPQSPYRGPVLGAVTLLILLAAYLLATKALRRYMAGRAQNPENVRNFLYFWRYAWLAVALVLGMLSFSGSLAALGISAAFVGMILGWSLQAPVTGMAAWLMIILKRPFKIGDRVIIAGITGDVEDITLTHVILNQVGGTVGGEERSGRGVLIPNATLFQQIIYNYNFESKHLLDEVVVTVTFESDLAEVERIMLEATREATAEVIAETGSKPTVRVEIAESGVRMRLRYQTLAMERQRTSDLINRCVLQGFAGGDRVEFAYQHMELLHRPKDPAVRSGRGAGEVRS